MGKKKTRGRSGPRQKNGRGLGLWGDGQPVQCTGTGFPFCRYEKEAGVGALIFIEGCTWGSLGRGGVSLQSWEEVCGFLELRVECWG